MSEMNISTATARALALELVHLGLRHVVICPGSRSAPLAYAFGELERQGLITAHVRIDERDAGFLALGLAKGARLAGHEQPVAVVTTSGTAVANLHPAVLEASYSYVPLLLLTADRPARLRATGANQTIDDQSRVLSDVRLSLDLPVGEVDMGNAAVTEGREDGLPGPSASVAAADAARRCVSAALGEGFAIGKPAGPVQCNVQFDVPLVPERQDFTWNTGLVEHAGQTAARVAAAGPGTTASDRSVPNSKPALLDPELAPALAALRPDSTVILAGDDFGLGQRRMGELSASFDIPILAEPSAPLFVHDNAIRSHADVLDGNAELRSRVETVLVAGKPTLFRPDAKLVADPHMNAVRVQPDLDRVDTGVWDDLVTTVRPSDTARTVLSAWQAAGRNLTRARTSESSNPAGVIAPALQTPGTVLLASSSVVRYADEVADRRATVVASRGLAGIDGLVSTAVGVAKALEGGKGPVRLLIGDLALLHDAGGLLRMEGEAPAHVQIFVLNDNGGRIFAGLEHGQDYLQPYFGKFFATPHGLTFANLARQYDWDYERLDSADDVARAVESSRPGLFEISLPHVLD